MELKIGDFGLATKNDSDGHPSIFSFPHGKSSFQVLKQTPQLE
jgi:hypothetical protein